MNIRKNIDYSEMYATLDRIMTAVMPQMELYCEIGKAVCMRTEKGAAVAAAEYLSKQYPDVQGCSPRNLRRMRDFYRTYEDHPALLASAMQVGWTQNVVIMEADLSMELREWYLKATSQFGWSKAELNEKIANNAHGDIVLTVDEETGNNVEQEEANGHHKIGISYYRENGNRHLIPKITCRMKSMREHRRRWLTILCQLFTENRNTNTLVIHCYALGGIMTTISKLMPHFLE